MREARQTSIAARKPAVSERPTRDVLIEAAGHEFNQVGYHGTNTNKIAQLAGFAPQTFYRHFEDKIDIFLAVYEAWQASERHAISRALRADASEAAMAKAVLQHHIAWRVFRSSLRLLAADEPRVRLARAASRERQIEAMARANDNKIDRVEAATALFVTERLCDAVADGEFEDLDIRSRDVVPRIVECLKQARGPNAHRSKERRTARKP